MTTFYQGDNVSYTRTNGEVVKGWVKRMYQDAVYIWDTTAHTIVAAPINRVVKGKGKANV